MRIATKHMIIRGVEMIIDVFHILWKHKNAHIHTDTTRVTCPLQDNAIDPAR